MNNYSSTTSTHRVVCPHENGWYVRVKFFFDLLSVRRFVCSDCGDVAMVQPKGDE